MIKGMWNYAAKVSDLGKATEFYTQTMEAAVLRSGEVFGCAYRLIRVGSTRIILFEKAPYEEQLGQDLPLGFLHAVYEVDDHETHMARLRQAGAKIIIEPTIIETDWDERKIAFFEAPDGMRMEITQILRVRHTV